MATEDVNEALAAAEVPATETTEKQPADKLERKWSFWFDNQSKPKQGAAWGASLRKAYTFDTVQDFWGVCLSSPFTYC
uniref:mRNA cap-binding protein n=1 Tax=Brassica campestris TaxID=3711 RepID=A0A385LK02_BRACM|nr:eukaryotic translation initiation factor 4E.a [Brassica rapa]